VALAPRPWRFRVHRGGCSSPVLQRADDLRRIGRSWRTTSLTSCWSIDVLVGIGSVPIPQCRRPRALLGLGHDLRQTADQLAHDFTDIVLGELALLSPVGWKPPPAPCPHIPVRTAQVG